MKTDQTIAVPALVRIKPGALDRLGVYLARAGDTRVAIIHSSGLLSRLLHRLTASLVQEHIHICHSAAIDDASFEQAAQQLVELPCECRAIVGFGGGKALDTAKYVSFLAGLPYYAVPTSISNDGFCSPQSSLTLRGRRRSLPARLPTSVVVDTEVCLQAPLELWHSGVGDLLAKITAIHDWKAAFHVRGEPVNDLASLLSDATVRQFMQRPVRDLEGIRLLATSLMLNGIAMEISGSSRPASGSEHLISHALDELTSRPRLHGLQVGVAAYISAQLQGQNAERIGKVLDQTSFWDTIRSDPFSRAEWLEAVQRAPAIKPGYYTVLSDRDCRSEVAQLIEQDPRLVGGFCSETHG